MPVKLVVRSVVDPAYTRELVYAAARITIGRGSDNLLVLPDERRILSKEHAELQVHGDRVDVVDLGSKNFTYLNDDRLVGHEPRAVARGDVLRLGNYELEVLLEAEVVEPVAPQDDNQTVFEFNPFWEQAAQLQEWLRDVRQVYAREMPGRRREALLCEALADALEAEVDEEVAEVIAAVFGGASPHEVADASVPSFEAAGSAAPAVQASDSTPGAPSEALAETLLQYVAGLLSIPWQFRHEFIGDTVMQSKATAVLYEGDAEALRRFLLAPDLSAEESARRRALLEEAAEALRMHQVALLDGYRACVQQGIQRFLDEVDLEQLRDQARQEARWYEKPFVRLRALQRLQERADALRREDWTVMERRIFRPAFIRAYLARMTSVPR